MSQHLQRIFGFALIAALLACSRDGQAATGPTPATASAPLFREASSSQPLQPEAAIPVQTSLAPLIERLKPMVVNISTNNAVKAPALGRGRGNRGGPGQGGNEEFQEFFERYFGRPAPDMPRERGSSLGSGFLLNAEGFILTNNHVVKDATEITVRLTDGRQFRATKVGTDADTDVALIRLTNPPKDLPAVVLGDSDAIRQGDFVLALGSPFGLDDTATLGIISAKHRQNVSMGGPYDDFLQTDAAINQGNSGGPLFNLRGEVVGINTAIVSPQIGQGIGFAVPINLAKALLPQLREKGRVSRGFMGVTVQPLDPDLSASLRLAPAQKGALVQSVIPDRPAAKAGIEPYDVILTVNGKEVDSASALTRAVSLIPPGQKAELQILRDASRGDGKWQKKSVSLTVEQRPSGDSASVEDEAPASGEADEGSKSLKLGVSLSPITPEFTKRTGIPAGTGVLVLGVVDGGPAQAGGVREGDVIVEVNRKPVKAPNDVVKLIAGVKDGEPASLRLRRGDASIIVSVLVGGRQ